MMLRVCACACISRRVGSPTARAAVRDALGCLASLRLAPVPSARMRRMWHIRARFARNAIGRAQGYRCAAATHVRDVQRSGVDRGAVSPRPARTARGPLRRPPPNAYARGVHTRTSRLQEVVQ